MTRSNPNTHQARLRIAIVCLQLTMVVGCAAESPPAQTEQPRSVAKTDPRVEKLVGGKTAASLIADLSQAKTSTAYRIDGFQSGQEPLPPTDKPQAIHGYPVTSSAVPIDDLSRTELSKILGDPGTYLWDESKACEFLPGIALQLAGDNVTVDVLICFSCDELVFYTDGKLAGHEDFDPRRSDLLRIAKKLFPDDKTIQSLK